MNKKTVFGGCLVGLCVFASMAQASTINFYYTTLGAPDVFSDSYNTTTNTISTATGTAIGDSQQGADGILLGPLVSGQQTLFFAGESDGYVYQIPAAGGSVVSLGNAGINAYFLAENSTGTTLFTFNNAGSVSTLPISGGMISGAGTVHTVTGPDTNISQLAFIGSTAYYVTAQPGTAGGDFGTLNTSTFATTQLFSGLTFAQDEVYDSFTGDIILFGDQQIDTYNPITNTLGTPTALGGGTCGTSTLTAGAVDGQGHAMVVGCGELEYVTFNSNGTVASVQQVTSPTGAKDIVFTGVTPEPSTVAFMLIGLAFTAVRRIRRNVA